MTDAPRYLITTADERTWKFDRPVLFLGEWCRRFDRKHIWSKMDAIVAEPYGLGRSRKDKDHALARAIEMQLLSVLCGELNIFHGTSHCRRYWQIILGHWLRRYVDVVFNRYQTLRQCVGAYRVSGTGRLIGSNYGLATRDSLSFILACNDSAWNSALYARILGFFPDSGLVVMDVPVEDGSCFEMPESFGRDSCGKRFARIVSWQVEALTDLFTRDDDAFIINSYLPPVQEAKLQVSLGQVPKHWRFPKVRKFEPDVELRKSLSLRVGKRFAGEFECCVAGLLFEVLPSCYLEGFHAMCTQVDSLPWPVRPSFIFTSSHFDTNEIFKCWVASKTESGVPYYVGQHGNNYGTHRYANPSVEESTADKFLTWGWTDGLPQHAAAFIFKTAGGKPQSYNPKGGLLLVETCLNHRVSIWDDYGEFEEYFKEQQAFVESLDPSLRGELTIRLSREFEIHDWAEDLRWQEFDRHLKIEKGARRISSLIGDCRLVVHSYDSTGILEGLSQNVPTMAFWRGGLDHVRDSAKAYYQLLIDAGIIHLTPQSAARQINRTWEDVVGWWESRDVQAARQTFCDRYARSSKSPIEDLKGILVGAHL